MYTLFVAIFTTMHHSVVALTWLKDLCLVGMVSVATIVVLKRRKPLAAHPLTRVSEIARRIYNGLDEVYPGRFCELKEAITLSLMIDSHLLVDDLFDYRLIEALSERVEIMFGVRFEATNKNDREQPSDDRVSVAQSMLMQPSERLRKRYSPFLNIVTAQESKYLPQAVIDHVAMFIAAPSPVDLQTYFKGNVLDLRNCVSFNQLIELQNAVKALAHSYVLTASGNPNSDCLAVDLRRALDPQTEEFRAFHGDRAAELARNISSSPSPRASVQLSLFSAAYAILHRIYAINNYDMRWGYDKIMTHRVVPTAAAEGRGFDVTRFVSNTFETVTAGRYGTTNR